MQIIIQLWVWKLYIFLKNKKMVQYLRIAKLFSFINISRYLS